MWNLVRTTPFTSFFHPVSQSLWRTKTKGRYFSNYSLCLPGMQLMKEQGSRVGWFPCMGIEKASPTSAVNSEAGIRALQARKKTLAPEPRLG